MHDSPPIWTVIRAGTALSRWAMAKPEAVLFPGQPRPHPDHVDYQFANGLTDVGELPCREALRALLPQRRVAQPTGPFADVFPGVDGPEVDFSCFRHRPTLITHAFQCRLRSPGGPARFRIATCGGVRLWLDAVEVAVFEPFERNRPKTSDVTIPLPAGESRLTVRLEDLHERDTTCFFALTYLEGPGLETALDLPVDPAELARAADLLEGLRTDAVFYETGAARLIADPAPETPIPITVSGIEPFTRGGISPDPEVKLTAKAALSHATPGMDIFPVDTTHFGCVSLRVTASAGGAQLSRTLGTTNLRPGLPLDGTLAERKAKAADHMAQAGGFDTSIALLLAMRDARPDYVARILDVTLTTIEERHDCSDFSILPLLRLWRDARDRVAPALQGRIRKAILNYRYWLDEPGDDVMWFWSENHVLCFHTAQLIAGHLFPNEVFPNSGKTGAQHEQDAKARLDRWFAAISENGLCEWNSAAYYPIDFLALFTLHDMVPELRAQSAALMDRIFVMTGLHCLNGVPAGSQGRCYEKELLAGPGTELGAIAAVAFGGAHRVGFDRASALFCLSDYTPPEIAQTFANPPAEATLTARYTQGLGHAGRLTLWKSAEAQLSTVSELETGAFGHQAQVLDVQCAAHPMARLWINHPGDLKPWGERRPSLLAGNHVMPRVAQVGPLGLMIYDLDRPWTDLHFTQLFAAPGAFSSPEDIAGWRIHRCGAARIAVWCSEPLAEVEGFYHGALHRAFGKRMAWAVALSQPEEADAAFHARLAGIAPRFDAEGLCLEAQSDGRALSLDFEGGLSIDGGLTPFAPLITDPQVAWGDEPLRPWQDKR